MWKSTLILHAHRELYFIMVNKVCAKFIPLSLLTLNELVYFIP
jgi:hypothetical protein